MSRSKHDYTCTLTTPPPDAACSNDAYGGGEIAYVGMTGKGVSVRVKCGEGEVVGKEQQYVEIYNFGDPNLGVAWEGYV